MQRSSAVLKTGKVRLCSLYPSYRKTGGAVRLNLDNLKKTFGEEWTDGLAVEVRALDELKAGTGARELVIQRPAETSLDTHEALKHHLHGVRFRLKVDGNTYTPDWHAPH